MEIIKNIKKNTIILLIITFLILYFILKDDLYSVMIALKTMDYRFIILAIIIFFLSVIIKSYAVYKTVNNKKKFTLMESIKHSIIVQFFNGITPFSSGGQPMEIYMLTEHDIPTTTATNIIIQNFIFYQTALVLYGVIAVGYNSIFHIFPKISFLQKLVLIGFTINILVAIGLFIITFSKKLTRTLTVLIINILGKLHILKDKSLTKENWRIRLEEFHESAKKLRKRKKLFIEGVLLNFISLTLLYSIPLFIIYALHDYNSISLMQTITSSAYVLIIGAFVPIPGASGGIEYGFFQFFGNFLNKNIIATCLLIWRFITYYLGMIIGALALSLEKKGDKS